MTGKRRAIGANHESYWEVRNQIADLLTLRAQGMLTQNEYEEKLEDVGRSLPSQARLVEKELPRGKTRFILRETVQGRILGEFEFHDGHPTGG
jgi:hypothetical protein